jgi:N-glycosylase/DNA lyase
VRYLNNKEAAELVKAYKSRKKEIIDRLNDFEESWSKNDEEIFSELCFCILTPQSNAVSCDEVICALKSSGLLFNGNIHQIRPFVKKARFYKNKTNYIIEARKTFSKNDAISVKGELDIQNILKTRTWLAENVKGIGYKEASHFLRNIGFGKDLAILDIHILKNLKKYGVIKDIPKTLTKIKYFEIENKLKIFSGKLRIPMSHLDLLFWSLETGKIFK